MKLDSLIISGFRHFKEKVVNFEPITFLEGENEAGKTTIIYAIELALTGNIAHPLFPDKNLQLLSFFNRAYSDTIRLNLRFKEGLQIDRRFVLSEEKGVLSYKQFLKVYPVPDHLKNIKEGSRIKDFQKHIDDMLGGGVVSFDFRTFHKNSPERKIDYLFNLHSTEKIEAESVIEKIKANSEFEGEKADILNAEIENSVDLKLSGLSLIRTAQAKISSQYSDVKSEVENSKKTVRGLAEIMEDETKVGEELETLNSEHSRINNDLESLKNSTGQLYDLRDEKTKKENRLTEIINELESANNDLQEQENIQLPTVQYGIPETVEELTALRKQNEAKIQEYREESNRLNQELNEASAVNSHDQEIELAILNDIREKSENNCYVCLSEQSHKFNKDFLNRITELEGNGTGQGDHKEKQERADYLRQEILNFVSVNDLIDQVIKKQNAIKEIGSRIERLEKEQIDTQKKVAEIDQRMAKIGDYQTYQEQSTGLKTLRDELFQKIQQKNQESGMLLAQKKAYQNYLAAKDRLEVIKYIKEKIADIKAEIIFKTFNKFSTQVNVDFQLLHGNGKNFDLRFADTRGNDNFLMGSISKNGNSIESFFDHFVDYDAENTASQIKILLAFLFNLPTKGFRLYLLDNLELISENYRKAFTDGLLSLSDKYDNIVIGSSSPLSPEHEPLSPKDRDPEDSIWKIYRQIDGLVTEVL